MQTTKWSVVSYLLVVMNGVVVVASVVAAKDMSMINGIKTIHSCQEQQNYRNKNINVLQRNERPQLTVQLEIFLINRQQPLVVQEGLF